MKNTHGLQRCLDCNISKPQNEIANLFHHICFECSNERHFTNVAIGNILRVYNLRYGEYSDELLEIEMARAKTRFIIRTGETSFIKYKTGNMITKVTNSAEMREALNENLHALITKKRKLLVVKEVNNTLGKILMDVKMELMQNALIGNGEAVSWFNSLDTGVRIRNIKTKELTTQ